MNTQAQSSRKIRQIKYVDQRIQFSLMIALLLLEVVMLIGALAYLNGEFKTIIEDSLYRIHPLPHADTVRMMLAALAKVVLLLMVFNIIAVFLADRIWATYIGSVLRLFRKVICSIWDLDLRLTPAEATHHEVLELALKWHANERQRCLAIRNLSDDLKVPGSTEDRIRLKMTLEQIRNQIK